MVSIHAGSSFLLIKPKPHLWFVLTKPEGEFGIFVGVMLRTQRGFTDKTVVLDVGDHPFVRHPSSIEYGGARFFYLKNIKRAIKDGKCRPQEEMSDDLLRRVRNGLFNSSYTVPAIFNYCQARFQSE